MNREFIHTPYYDRVVNNVMSSILGKTKAKGKGVSVAQHTFWLPSDNFENKDLECTYSSRKAKWTDLRDNDMLTLVAHGDAVWSSYIKWKQTHAARDKKGNLKEVVDGKHWFGVTDTVEYLEQMVQPAYNQKGCPIYLNINITACIAAKGGLFGKSFCEQLAAKLQGRKNKMIYGKVIGYPGIVFADKHFSQGVSISGSGRFSGLARYFTGHNNANNEGFNRIQFGIDI